MISGMFEPSTVPSGPEFYGTDVTSSKSPTRAVMPLHKNRHVHQKKANDTKPNGMDIDITTKS